MIWHWKSLIGYAGTVVATVLVSFVVEWHIRTDWNIYWLDGLIRWWGDFVMFGWVKEYQSLLGGIFALCAGAFVLLSAVYQRHTANLDAIKLSRDQLEMSIIRAAIEYRRLLHQIRRREISDALTTVRALENTILMFASRAYPLANWLIRINPLLDKHLVTAKSEQDVNSEWPSSGDDTPRLRALGYALLVVEYLSLTARLINPTGEYVHRPRERGPTEDRLRTETGMGLADFANSEFAVDS
jgi:hypothetical protein